LVFEKLAIFGIESIAKKVGKIFEKSEFCQYLQIRHHLATLCALLVINANMREHCDVTVTTVAVATGFGKTSRITNYITQ